MAHKHADSHTARVPGPWLLCQAEEEAATPLPFVAPFFFTNFPHRMFGQLHHHSVCRRSRAQLKHCLTPSAAVSPDGWIHSFTSPITISHTTDELSHKDSPRSDVEPDSKTADFAARLRLRLSPSFSPSPTARAPAMFPGRRCAAQLACSRPLKMSGRRNSLFLSAARLHM